jgi:hypothetical protein
VKNSTTLKVRSNSNTTEIAVNTKSTTEKIVDDIDRPEINDTSTI